MKRKTKPSSTDTISKCVLSLETNEKVLREIAGRVRFSLDHHKKFGKLPAVEIWNPRKDGVELYGGLRKSNIHIFLEKDYVIRGDARAYQVELVESAKRQNVIVYLATGMGKTFIGILLMKHFLQPPPPSPPLLPPKKKWIVFMTSSVPLVIQQTVAIRANVSATVLPLYAHVDPEMSPVLSQVNEADILVLTHGALKEILSRFPDVFTLGDVSLLIMDECHHASGKHDYKLIMEDYYHQLEPQERPRILGLTASPIVNPRVNDLARIRREMAELENILDSKIVTSFSNLPFQGIREEAVQFSQPNCPDISDAILLFLRQSPPIHSCRRREIGHLYHLLFILGPDPTLLFTSILIQEMRRNDFEGETLLQFENFLAQMKKFCDSLLQPWKKYGFLAWNGGDYTWHISEKMARLLQLLERLHPRRIVKRQETTGEDTLEEIEVPELESTEIVTVIFVERRATTTALKLYLKKCRPELSCECLVSPNLSASFKYKKRGLETVEKSLLKEMSTSIAKQADILRRVRQGKIQVIIATAVANEGIDIPSCTNVIVFRGLFSPCEYIQTKGRARAEKAHLFVFEDPDSKRRSLRELKSITRSMFSLFTSTPPPSDPLPLSFTSLSITSQISHLCSSLQSHQLVGLEPEEFEILMKGEFCAGIAKGRLNNSISSLYRFCVFSVVDPSLRAARSSLLSLLPVFPPGGNALLLPRHIPQEKRSIRLPQPLWVLTRKDKKALLSLVACHRLRKLGVLNERLLPLSDSKDFEHVFTEIFPTAPTITPSLTAELKEDGGSISGYLYPIEIVGGPRYEKELKRVGGSSSPFGVFTLEKICTWRAGDASGEWNEKIKPLWFSHSYFGQVKTSILEPVPISFTEEERASLEHFYTQIMSGRWLRKTRTDVYRLNTAPSGVSDTPDQGERAPESPLWYLVAPVGRNDQGQLHVDWQTVRSLMLTQSRTPHVLNQALLSSSPVFLPESQSLPPSPSPSSSSSPLPHPSPFSQTENVPRFIPQVWRPKYTPNRRYVVFGPSHLSSADRLPPRTEKEEKQEWSFEDYYQNLYGAETETCRMFHAVPLWTLPLSMGLLSFGSDPPESEPDGLSREKDTLLAESLCDVDPHIPFASLFLGTFFLPQVLYYFTHVFSTWSFVRHTRKVSTELFDILTSLDFIDVMHALTPLSCRMNWFSYERLEFLGDGVLKLVHTDALVSSRLSQWLSYLPEGQLSFLRSELGKNSRFTEIATSLGFSPFLLLRPLARSIWVPGGLVLQGVNPNEDEEEYSFSSEEAHRKRVLADVMESIIGIIFLRLGYHTARQVASLLYLVNPSLCPLSSGKVHIPANGQPETGVILGYKFENKDLLEEARTHPSMIEGSVPSYQKLEWIGDAVLEIYVRDHLFRAYPSVSVHVLSSLRSNSVCSQALAYISIIHSIFSLPYVQDARLVSQITRYVDSIKSFQDLRGGLQQKEEVYLWETDPPKILCDVVESIIGAIHMDSNFNLETGYSIMKTLMAPYLEIVEESFKEKTKEGDQSLEWAYLHPVQEVYQKFPTDLQIEELKMDGSEKKREQKKGNQKKKEEEGEEEEDDEEEEGEEERGVSLNQRVRVLFQGVVLLETNHPSRVVAKNMACAFAAQFARHHPDLLEKLKQLNEAYSQKISIIDKEKKRKR